MTAAVCERHSPLQTACPTPSLRSRRLPREPSAADPRRARLPLETALRGRREPQPCPQAGSPARAGQIERSSASAVDGGLLRVEQLDRRRSGRRPLANQLLSWPRLPGGRGRAPAAGIRASAEGPLFAGSPCGIGSQKITSGAPRERVGDPGHRRHVRLAEVGVEILLRAPALDDHEAVRDQPCRDAGRRSGSPSSPWLPSITAPNRSTRLVRVAGQHLDDRDDRPPAVSASRLPVPGGVGREAVLLEVVAQGARARRGRSSRCARRRGSAPRAPRSA